MNRRQLGCALLGLAAARSAGRADDAPAPTPPGSIPITVRAGRFERRDPLVDFAVPADRLPPGVAARLDAGPVALDLVASVPPGGPPGAGRGTAEARRGPDGTVRVVGFLPGPIPAGGEARFWLGGGEPGPGPPSPSPWAVAAVPGRAVTIARRGDRDRDRPVFTYNAGPTTPPPGQADPKLARAAYIHPAFSPAGALVTGDFSPYHPHHRGFFLAYVHTRWGDLAPDFWNIQAGTGRIVADGVEPPVAGPVACRFAAHHRWEALRPGAGGGEPRVALRERWDVAVYDVPGTPCWLVDLTSSQRAEGHPLEVLPYRYGGMAYRSAEPSVRGPIDVLTAEGRHRFDGDQRPTRWVDLAGPTGEGSPNYAGAMIADHPTNPHHPTVVRIHPITLPFFSFVPAYGVPLTIGVDRVATFRYRIAIHDGRPDPAWNDRIARDFADPPEVRPD